MYMIVEMNNTNPVKLVHITKTSRKFVFLISVANSEASSFISITYTNANKDRLICLICDID